METLRRGAKWYMSSGSGERPMLERMRRDTVDTGQLVGGGAQCMVRA